MYSRRVICFYKIYKKITVKRCIRKFLLNNVYVNTGRLAINDCVDRRGNWRILSIIYLQVLRSIGVMELLTDESTKRHT